MQGYDLLQEFFFFNSDHFYLCSSDDCSQKPQNFGSLRSEENQNGKRPMVRTVHRFVPRSDVVSPAKV